MSTAVRSWLERLALPLLFGAVWAACENGIAISGTDPPLGPVQRADGALIAADFSSSADAGASSPSDLALAAVDLAMASPDAQLASLDLAMASQQHDLAMVATDLRVSPSDLRVAADLATVPPPSDLRIAYDLAVAPRDLAMPPADLATVPADLATAPHDLATLGAYPSGPYSGAVGGVVPNFSYSGYFDKTVTSGLISSHATYGTVTMDEFRNAGARYLLTFGVSYT